MRNLKRRMADLSQLAILFSVGGLLYNWVYYGNFQINYFTYAQVGDLIMAFGSAIEALLRIGDDVVVFGLSYAFAAFLVPFLTFARSPKSPFFRIYIRQIAFLTSKLFPNSPKSILSTMNAKEFADHEFEKLHEIFAPRMYILGLGIAVTLMFSLLIYGANRSADAILSGDRTKISPSEFLLSKFSPDSDARESFYFLGTAGSRSFYLGIVESLAIQNDEGKSLKKNECVVYVVTEVTLEYSYVIEQTDFCSGEFE